MRDRIMMAASVLIRMGAGLLVFVLMARGLGPAEYGFVATIFAYATLASLLTDFGFASKTLRDIAANRDRGGFILNESLSVKIYLTLLVIGFAAILIVFMPGELRVRGAGALLGLAVLLGAVGDLALTAYRAMGRYTSETLLTIWTSILHLSLIGGASMSGGGVLAISVLFVLSRAIYTVVAIIGAGRVLGRGFSLQAPSQTWTAVNGAWGWAVDSGLGYLTSQMDGVLVAALFGLQSAGIYQAGARFIQAALNLISILAAVHIPRLARDNQNLGSLTSEEWKMILEFSAIGIVLGAIFLVGGGSITKYVLGSQYNAVNALWPGFAAFLTLRYMAASLGAALSARGMPVTRVIGQLVAVAIVGIGIWWVAPQLGLIAVPWIMSAGAAATLVAYSTARFLMTKSGGAMQISSPMARRRCKNNDA